MRPSPSTRPETPDAGYRFFSNFLQARARRIPKPVLQERVQETFVELCRDLEPTLSVEIGAHEGTFSRELKKAVPGARCVAFEANPHVHERYVAELTDAGVEYLPRAISETDGTVDLAIPRRLSNRSKGPANRMGSLSHHREETAADTVAVESTPLDRFLTVLDDDRLVAWIDVEGASETVLRGSRSTLARASLVHIEVESEPVWGGQWLDVDVARFFADLGFVPIMRDIQRRWQYNVVFASGDVATRPDVARAAARVYRPAGKRRTG
jgi:FkbM family methyltransferase